MNTEIIHKLDLISKKMDEVFVSEDTIKKMQVQIQRNTQWRTLAIIVTSCLTILTFSVVCFIILAAVTQPQINQIEQINQPYFTNP